MDETDPQPTDFPIALPTSAAAVFFILLAVLFSPAVATALSSEPTAAPSAAAITLSLLYFAVFSFVLVVLTLRIARLPFGNAFGLKRTPALAVLKGLNFGIATTPLLMVASGLLAILANRIGLNLEQQPIFGYLDDGGLPKWAEMLVIFFIIALAPVYEELVFRGLAFPALFAWRKNFWSAAWISGTLFALVHCNAAAFVPLTLLGVILCIGYRESKSIVTPIVMHMVFNAANLTVWLIAHNINPHR